MLAGFKNHWNVGFCFVFCFLQGLEVYTAGLQNEHSKLPVVVPVLLAHPYPRFCVTNWRTGGGEEEVEERGGGLLTVLDRAGWLLPTVVMSDYSRRSLLWSEYETSPIDSLV